MTDGREHAGEGEEYRDPEPFFVDAQGLSLGFYPAGKDRLDRLLELIEQADTSIKMAFYIFARDEAACSVRDALADAARRGVDVRVMVDGFGAEADEDFFTPVVEAGGRFDSFLARFSRRYLIRNHQKIVIVDDKVAMLGGFNIENSYFDPPERNGWNDLAVTVEGEVVDQIEQWYGELEDWICNERSQFRAISRSVRQWSAGEGPVQLLIGGPTRGLSSWARCMGRDLMYGRKLDMMMAYFSPPRRLRRRIRDIARKGETRLLMAGKSDNGATLGASRLLYSNLLKAGARIWEFQPCKLHTKLIVLDDAVYLGSANFDMRSLYLNLEIVLRVEDRALADRLREFIHLHLPASREITLEKHEKDATMLTRIRWIASWFLVSVVDYTVSRRLNLGL